jgi:P-type Ca2+ transporter type 2C
MGISNYGQSGLDEEAVLASRMANGSNTLPNSREPSILKQFLELALEPMFLLLLATSGIYFFMGQPADAIFMIAAMLMVSAISFYQNNKSKNAIKALRNLTAPGCKVIRDHNLQEIKTADLVVNDIMLVEEGVLVPADGVILQSWDFLVNESILTGESLGVSKSTAGNNNTVFQGCTVAAGSAICKVTAVGAATALGKIGKSIEDITEEPSPLQIHVDRFVKYMVWVGGVIFLLVWIVQYSQGIGLTNSLLKALTLAMSLIPEEIPVTFSTFMALGAWRLLKKGIIVKQTKTVETLGSATIICTDKTGTITENRMDLAALYLPGQEPELYPLKTVNPGYKKLLSYAVWASEPNPFDPMEQALHKAYSNAIFPDERPKWTLCQEYPLSGRPPMMTHIFTDPDNHRLIAAKGAPEAIFAVCNLSGPEKEGAEKAMQQLASKGFRVLGVAQSSFEGNDFPANQQDLPCNFLGLVAFYDPPKPNMEKVFKGFNQAGIKIKILTGDNEATTAHIASQTGISGYKKSLNAETLFMLENHELNNSISDTTLFTRMYPEAKLRVINALKAQGEIIAMLGDGVNDGPALKAAHIGIAMGQNGTEIAKQAANLIITDDNLGRLLYAIAMGRRMYINLKKAIRYIISIHIPIVLMVLIPLALGWAFPNIFTPVHVIFLEMIMGPTCSIIFENEPMEENAMLVPPRKASTSFFTFSEIAISVCQGLFITAGLLLVYQYALQEGLTENATRTLVYIALISANVALTLVNRSFYYSVLHTLQYKNNLMGLIIGITLVLSVLIITVPFLATLFAFAPVGIKHAFISIITGLLSVIWLEIVKYYNRLKKPNGVLAA